MGEAKRKKALPMMPDVRIPESQQLAARGLLELAQREEQEAKERIRARQFALNSWVGDLMDSMNLPKDKYRFDLSQLIFVDVRKAQQIK